jgi:hypothetical protein
MKLKHWLFLGIAAVGALYFWHTYSQHGGVSGFKQGLGLS